MRRSKSHLSQRVTPEKRTQNRPRIRFGPFQFCCHRWNLSNNNVTHFIVKKTQQLLLMGKICTSNGMVVRVEYSIHVPSIRVTNHRRFSFLIQNGKIFVLQIHPVGHSKLFDIRLPRPNILVVTKFPQQGIFELIIHMCRGSFFFFLPKQIISMPVVDHCFFSHSTVRTINGTIESTVEYDQIFCE